MSFANVCSNFVFDFCVPVLIRQDVQRLQDEREGFLCNLRVFHSCFSFGADGSDVQDPAAMLACEGRVVEELEAEKDKVASLNDQVKHFSQGPYTERSPVNSLPIWSCWSWPHLFFTLFLDFGMGEEAGWTEDWRGNCTLQYEIWKQHTKDKKQTAQG